MFCKAFSPILNWKYHTKINISRLSEIIALFFHSSQHIAVIVIGINHIRVPSSPILSTGRVAHPADRQVGSAPLISHK